MAIKLTYFGIEGVAEKIRLTCHIGGIEFEDVRISFEEWGALKSTTKYGQLPIMTLDGGEQIAQSGAMLRYVGSRAGLYPTDPLQQLAVEEVIGLEEDIGRMVVPSMYVAMRPHMYGYPEDIPKEQTKEIQTKLRAKLMEADQLPKMLGYLEAMLVKSGTGFFVGPAPTIADCQVVGRLRHLTSGILDGIPKTILADFPELTAFMAKFHELPPVKAYYEAPSAAKDAAKPMGSGVQAGLTPEESAQKGQELIEAARDGDVDAVQRLLKAGASVSAVDNDGMTALHRSACNGHLDIVRALLEAGASVSALDPDGSTALHWSARGGQETTDIVRALLEAGASVSAVNKTGLTALHWSAVNGHLDIVRALLEAGASVSAVDNDGETVLHWGAVNGFHYVASNRRLDVTRALLEAKASVEVKATAGRWQGKTPLGVVLAQNRTQVADLLRQYGARE